jgi:hypothetical protein
MSERKADGTLRQTQPVAVKGDPERTRRLIDSIDREWKYTSGINAWAPGEVVTPEQEKEFIAEFESIAFAGMDPDQYDILWVRHVEDDGHELHYVIPRLELTAGKAFNAFAPGWQRHFDPLRDKWNLKHGWSRPDDPARARLQQLGALSKYSSTKREALETLHAYVLREVTEGRVSNRTELVASFRDAGLEVTREGKDYVTVQLDDGSKHRLKGTLYAESFDRQRFVETAPGESTAEPGRDRADHGERITKLNRELEQIREKRAAYNSKRYQTADRVHRADLEPGPGATPERSPADPEKAPAMAPAAVALGDHLRRELGHSAITDMVDRQGSIRQASRDPHDERDPSQLPDLGDPDDRNNQRPLPDSAAGRDPGDGLHTQRRQASRQTQTEVTHHAKPNPQRLGTQPPPRARGQLQRLSQCGLVHDPRPNEMLLPRDVPCHVRQLGSFGNRDSMRRSEHWQRLTKEQYKQQLIQQIMGIDHAADLWNIRWVDQYGNWVDFKDGGRLELSDTKHSAKGMSNAMAAKRLIASNKAAGWTRIGMSGKPGFIKLCALEALKNGIEPVSENEKQAKIINKAREIFERDRARKEVERSIAENADRAQQSNAAATAASADLAAANRSLSEAIQRSENDLRPRLEAVMSNELEEMKRINIADYLIVQGYQLNKLKSSKNALCYDHPTGDRLIVGTDANSGHSIYCSVRDDNDNGTIIDLIQKRHGLNLGQVRKELRPWIGRGPLDQLEIQTPQPRPEPATKDKVAQARGLAACERIGNHHEYLEGRGINPETLRHFRKRVFTDGRGNAIFPHFDALGVSGLEIKNARFTGFSKGGEKGLWLSGPADAERLVICESAIDSLSHYQLDHKTPLREKTLYVSTTGKLNPESRANLQRLLDKLETAEIVAGFDNDAGGDRLAVELQEMVGKREIIRHRPNRKDWNEELQHQRQLIEEHYRQLEEENEMVGLSM